MTIPDTGEQLQQEPLFFQCKKNQDAVLVFQLYKDITRMVKWNLSTVSIAFTASVYKGSTPVLSKANGSVQWDKTNAATGLLRLNLLPADIALNRWLFAELTITVGAQVFRSPDIILDIEGQV